MADRVSRKPRSAIMRSVGSEDTWPELAARRFLHGLGVGYRLYANIFRVLRILRCHGCRRRLLCTVGFGR